MESVHVRSKAAGITAVINSMGYRPVESTVIVVINDRRMVGAIGRIDFAASVDPVKWAATLIAPFIRMGERTIVIMHFMDERGTHAEHIKALNEAAVLAGFTIRDEMTVVGDRFWSSCCTSEECCPPEGEQWERDEVVDLEFAVRGVAPAEDDTSRADIAASVQAGPDPLPRIAVITEVPQGMFDDACQAVVEMLEGKVPSDSLIDTLGIAVASSIDFRDLLIGRVTGSVPEAAFGATAQEHAALLVVDDVDWAALRRVVPSVAQRVPDAAGSEALLCVLSHFVMLDGVVSKALLDRVLAITATYRLALLTMQMHKLGINPVRRGVRA